MVDYLEGTNLKTNLVEINGSWYLLVTKCLEHINVEPKKDEVILRLDTIKNKKVLIVEKNG